MHTLTRVLPLVLLLPSLVQGDRNSGCPTWGCLAWGTFSLSSEVPDNNVHNVTWSYVLEEVPASHDGPNWKGQGCVSNQDVVVCPTEKGYTSIDPVTGKQLWNYTAMDKPYLPVTDIYGDVIGMDWKSLCYVGNDGTPKNPIPVKILDPKFGVMVSNNSILLLTSSRTDTAQIITYGTDGIIDASFQLVGNWERTNGTFVPCSHPVIAGSRVYLVTSFVPDGQNATTNGWKRLFAIDLLNQMAPRIKLAWYFNFFRETDANIHPHQTMAPADEDTAPVVTYSGGFVYVNLPLSSNKKASKSESTPAFLFGIRDDGTSGTLVFKAQTWSSPMAIYDTYDNPISRRGSAPSSTNAVWVISGSLDTILGYCLLNGTVVQVIDVNKLAGLDSQTRITSKLSVTRQASPSSSNSNEDVLVLGATDPKGDAHLIVLGADPSRNSSRLMWSTKLNTETSPGTTWSIEGQIVNTVQNMPNMPHHRWGEQIKAGLVAMLVERSKTSRKSHIKAVF